MSLLLLLLACTPPAPPVLAPDRSVTVSATSRVNVVPDEATIALTFSSTASSMKRSHVAAAQAVETFRTAVAPIVPADALELCGTTDDPNYRWDESDRIVSYTSSARLNVRTRDFERVADVVDAAVAAGVTSVSVDYHSTTLPEHKKRARDLALAAAKAKAEQLAAGTGARLGEVRTVSEGGSSTGRGYASFANVVQTEVTEASDADTPLSPGTTPLELTVEVTWALGS